MVGLTLPRSWIITGGPRQIRACMRLTAREATRMVSVLVSADRHDPVAERHAPHGGSFEHRELQRFSARPDGERLRIDVPLLHGADDTPAAFFTAPDDQRYSHAAQCSLSALGTSPPSFTFETGMTAPTLS